MRTPLSVLILEDNLDDAELLSMELHRAGFEPRWTRVDDADGFRAGLAAGPDIVLADYSLPQLNALDALRLRDEAGRDTPVIVVTGVMNEETCVQSLRHGAVDYLLKDRLARLGPAVEHALAQRRLITERRWAEESARGTASILRAVVDAAPALVYLTDRVGRFLLVNAKFELLFGVTNDEVRGRTADSLPPYPLVDSFPLRDARCLSSRSVVEAEESYRDSETERVYLSSRYPLLDQDGEVYAVAAMYTDITRQKRTEADLRAARAALEQKADELARANENLTELDRLKSQFIANVSHELRTPLTSIRGYAEILNDSGPDGLRPAQQRIVRIIDQNSERLLGLIEDLLNFSRLESGQLPLELASVDVVAMVERCYTMIGPMLRAQPNLKLDTVTAPGVGTVVADGEQLERALVNLLSNAVKFSPDGGVVTVRAGHDGPWVVISVTDTGMGIPAAEQPKLFDRFFRSTEAQHRSIPGTGLGLAITRAIVDAHGGTVTMSSREGAGTTFTVRLPATPPAGNTPSAR